MLHQTSPQHQFLATSSELQNFQYLCSSRRKKSLQHHWISVVKGGVLLRLGKTDYYFGANTSLWIPANCLVALTYLPNTKLVQWSFSQRISADFPKNAGLVNNSVIAQGIIDKRVKSTELNDAYLNVMQLEALQLSPTVNGFGEAAQSIATLKSVDSTKVEKLQQFTAIRDAQKNILSGKSVQKEWDAIRLNLGDDPVKTWESIVGQPIEV
ncbi:hypothetical protein [Vibrio ulleungensis]|uniref:Uncharacterized protein n=1 Tax=Vibrio ulleungensis TaxID=2807619 RepID=A0ABS2HIP8_9VIBR|nr:hypothetical protein [Vibrio ulleungensis]MBM7036971.1 hypothetical protein [Vibrio ulleungensis]